MEFRVQLTQPLPDPERLAAMLESEDPAAVSEIDVSERVWRVNTALDSRDLAALLGRLGCPIPLSSITVLPSVCCGGCSG